MPRVGGKHFGYGKKGRNKARAYARRSGQQVRSYDGIVGEYDAGTGRLLRAIDKGGDTRGARSGARQGNKARFNGTP